MRARGQRGTLCLVHCWRTTKMLVFDAKKYKLAGSKYTFGPASAQHYRNWRSCSPAKTPHFANWRAVSCTQNLFHKTQKLVQLIKTAGSRKQNNIFYLQVIQVMQVYTSLFPQDMIQDMYILYLNMIIYTNYNITNYTNTFHSNRQEQYGTWAHISSLGFQVTLT